MPTIPKRSASNSGEDMHSSPGWTPPPVSDKRRKTKEVQANAAAAILPSLDAVLDILAKANLHVHLEHRLLICLLCARAVSPNARRVSEHIKAHHERGFGAGIGPAVELLPHYGFQDLSTWVPPPFVTARITQLEELDGFCCGVSNCFFARLREQEVTKHCSQEHPFMVLPTATKVHYVNRNKAATCFAIRIGHEAPRRKGLIHEALARLDARTAAPLLADGQEATAEVVRRLRRLPQDSRFLNAMQFQYHFSFEGTTHEGLARLRLLSIDQFNVELRHHSDFAVDAQITPGFSAACKRLVVERFLAFLHKAQASGRGLTKDLHLPPHSGILDSTIRAYANQWTSMIVAMAAVSNMSDKQATLHGVMAAKVCVQSVKRLGILLRDLQGGTSSSTLGEVSEQISQAQSCDTSPRHCGPLIFFSSLAALTVQAGRGGWIEPRPFSQPLAHVSLFLRLELFNMALREGTMLHASTSRWVVSDDNPRDHDPEYYGYLLQAIANVTERLGDTHPTSQLAELHRRQVYVSQIPPRPSVPVQYNQMLRTLNFEGCTYSTQSFRDLATIVIEELRTAVNTLANIGGIVERPKDTYFDMAYQRSMMDSSDSLLSNETFLTDPRSIRTLEHVVTAADVVSEHLESQPAVAESLLLGEGPFITAYLAAENRFLKILAVAMHSLGGNFPRITDVLSAKLRDTSMDKRSIFIDHTTQLVYSVFAHPKKASSDNDNQIVARFYPRAVTQCLLHYLVRDRPLLDLVRTAVTKRNNENHTDLELLKAKNYLFVAASTGETISRDTFSRTFRRLTALAELGSGGINPSTARHLLTAAARYLGLDGVTDNADEDEEDITAFDLQAYHGTSMTLHGASEPSTAVLDPDAFDCFREASLAYHAFCGQDDEQATEAAVSNIETQSMVSDSMIAQALIKWTGQPSKTSYGQAFKSPFQRMILQTLVEQQQVTEAFHRPLCVISPTGSGKTAMFMCPAMLAPAQELTVLFVPSRALLDQHISKIRRSGMPSMEWCAGKDIPVGTRVVLISYDAAVVANGKPLFKALAKHTVTRFVFDEAHEIVTARHYRESFQLLVHLAPILRDHRILFVGATISFDMMKVLPALLGLHATLYEPVVLRSELLVCREIEYIIEPATDSKDALVNAVKFLHGCSGRVLVIARCQDLAVAVFDALCFDEKKGVLLHTHNDDEFDAGPIHDFTMRKDAILIGTSALTSGLDLPQIDSIVQLGNPYSLLDIVKTAGRLMRADGTCGQWKLFSMHLNDGEVAEMQEKDKRQFGAHFQHLVQALVEDESLCIYSTLAAAVQDAQKGRCTEIGLRKPCSRCFADALPPIIVDAPLAFATPPPVIISSARPFAMFNHRFQMASDTPTPLPIAINPDAETMHVVEGIFLLTNRAYDYCLGCMMSGHTDFASHRPFHCPRDCGTQAQKFLLTDQDITALLQRNTVEGTCCWKCALPIMICQHLSSTSESAKCMSFAQLPIKVLKLLLGSEQLYSFWLDRQQSSYVYLPQDFAVASSPDDPELFGPSVTAGNLPGWKGGILLLTLFQWVRMVLGRKE